MLDWLYLLQTPYFDSLSLSLWRIYRRFCPCYFRNLIKYLYTCIYNTSIIFPLSSFIGYQGNAAICQRYLIILYQWLIMDEKVRSKQEYSKIINYRIWAQGLFMNLFSSVFFVLWVWCEKSIKKVYLITLKTCM